MLRWLLIVLGGASFVLVGFAPRPAYVVVLDRAPGEVRVGVPFQVGFSIRASEGTEPPAGLAPLVVATNAATRGRIKVAARPNSMAGHFEALMILPEAGRWQWEIYPEGEAGATPVAMSPLVVGDASEGWLQSTLSLALLAVLGAVVGVSVAVARAVKRPLGSEVALRVE
jgi:hypothetical protein